MDEPNTPNQALPHDPADAQGPAISVFLPAHNEEANVRRVVQGLQGVLEDVASEYEIIVVDDGSRDGTAAEVIRMARAEPRIRLVQHPENRGYGGALISGFQACRHPWIFFTDGDGQFDPEELRLLLAQREEAELVIGYRRGRQDHPARKLNAEAWRWLVWLVLGVKVRDVDCAFKLIRREVLDRIELTAMGAVISAELLVKAQRAGFRILEVPVSHLPRTAGQPSGGNLRVILKAFRELARLRRALRRIGP